MSLTHYDQAIAVIGKPTNSPDVDRLCEQMVITLTVFRKDYQAIATELMAMYESAAEHNIDVSRHAVFNLAQCMLQ